MFLQSEDKNGLPTARAAERKRKAERINYLGSAGGQSEARHREKGGNRGRWVGGSARYSVFTKDPACRVGTGPISGKIVLLLQFSLLAKSV